MLKIDKLKSGFAVVGKFCNREEFNKAKELVKDLPNGTYFTNDQFEYLINELTILEEVTKWK